MGSYCDFKIADYTIGSSKSYVDPLVMTLFRENDKHTYERRYGTAKDEIQTAVEYRVTVGHAIDRLNVMGFTLDRAKRVLKEDVQARLAEYREDEEFWGDNITVLEANTFADYVEAFRVLLASGVRADIYLKSFPDSAPLIHHILNDCADSLYWGFPCSDMRHLIRAVLEVAPPEEWVIQDITDVVDAGYYKQEAEVCNEALNELTCDYPANAKIIIVTEGITDKEVLEPSLKLLYPHLHEYYSFMDFAVRPQGGVGHMVNLLKSFAGAGIENRTIFLCDNDTAAYSAVDMLRNIDIPSNITVLHYPDIELARDYPTLGPSGSISMNVNKLAGSIELYLGKDILEINGQLEPIQWKGYDEKLGRYQGEIMHKSDLKERFLRKLTKCQRDPSTLVAIEWYEIRCILTQIFSAFNS